jgi:hypothetical protein
MAGPRVREYTNITTCLLAGLLILLHSFYATNCCWTRPWKTRLGFGNQRIALYQGTTLVVPPSGQKVRASAPATAKYSRISNGKSAGALESA